MEVRMKKVLLAVSAMTLLMTGMAFAEVETRAIDQSSANKEQQVDKGTGSGQLKGPEAKPPDKQQEQVTKIEDKAKSAPVMTEEQKKEWANIGLPKSRTARINERLKHERAGRHK
jgi:opacity protein-like surface antigen